MANSHKLWRRPGIEAAIGTKLLPPDVPVYFSELDLETRLALPFEFGISMGRIAGKGDLSYDMHPDNILFTGESPLAFDFGAIEHVELTPAAFLPWLADLRANWKQDFGALLAGIVQGIRVETAIESPNLATDLITALGGRRTNEPEWPLRVTFVEALSKVELSREGELTIGDFRAFRAISMDRDEELTMNLLATIMGGATQEDLLAHPIPLEVNHAALSNILKKGGNVWREARRTLWLLTFVLVQLTNKINQKEEWPLDVTLLQAAYLALQWNSQDSRYFEWLLIFSRYSDIWRRLCRPKQRLAHAEVLSVLGYVSSSSLTHLHAFRFSNELVHGGKAKIALWSNAWAALHQIRGCEQAFAAWAGQAHDSFTEATPALRVLANTQGAAIKCIASSISELLQKPTDCPWITFGTENAPTIMSEMDWCRKLLDIVKTSANCGAALAKHFEGLPAAADLSRLGIHDMSFVRRNAE
jgi:hypothetical protein